MTLYQDALQLETIEEGHYVWRPTSDWYQGFGTYGGLIFAALIRAIEKESEFPVRRLSVDLCAPVVEAEVTIKVRLMRQGLNSQFFQIECRQKKKVCVVASATTGCERVTELDRREGRTLNLEETKAASFEDPDMPAFCDHFDYWPTLGTFPYPAGADLKVGGWLQSKEEVKLDQAHICALIDAWWPALLVASQGPRPMGTISFTIDFVHPPLDGSIAGPTFVECASPIIEEGYSVEYDRLWSADGTLLACAQQLVVVIM